MILFKGSQLGDSAKTDRQIGILSGYWDYSRHQCNIGIETDIQTTTTVLFAHLKLFSVASNIPKKKSIQMIFSLESIPTHVVL